jgi:hypothetical protein
MDAPLSNFAFNFNLRRYIKVSGVPDKIRKQSDVVANALKAES